MRIYWTPTALTLISRRNTSKSVGNISPVPPKAKYGFGSATCRRKLGMSSGRCTSASSRFQLGWPAIPRLANTPVCQWTRRGEDLRPIGLEVVGDSLELKTQGVGATKRHDSRVHF